MGKQSGKSMDQPSYQIRDLVLGKLRGFPPWPGMVVDPDSTPQDVLKERPSSKKTPFYCVRFFPTGDYAWLVSKNISRLPKHEIESIINEPSKKSGNLHKGYIIALDPTDWEAEKDALCATTGEEKANTEIDQLKKKKTQSTKRKRDRDTATKSKPSKSTPKKAPSESAASKKRSTSGGAEGKTNGSGLKALIESKAGNGEGQVEDDEDAGPSNKTSPPPAKKAKHKKEGQEVKDRE